jgi:hypothetical protein
MHFRMQERETASLAADEMSIEQRVEINICVIIGNELEIV